MNTTLAATTRPSGNKGDSRKLRAVGKLPAVMYGPNDEPTPIAVDSEELTTIFRKTRDRNTVVEIELDGNTYPTLVREVQRHPVSRKLVHADFYRLAADRKVEVMIPIEGVGRPAGAILGGRLRLIRRTVKARCDFDKIPSKLAVNISPMHIGDMVKASEIPLPEGVELVYDNDYNVLTIYGKKVKGDKKKEG